MISSTLSFVLMTVLCSDAFAHANGPPLSACFDFEPGSPHGNVPGTGNGGFVFVIPKLLAKNVSVSDGGFGYEPSVIYRG